eukprot:CAMPEP_0198730360 /NCGR_PEP_ID=MMETSP1475-20131203/24206_1 /TAXON_ID= ORGANISM="Unidentified sp., Strain CCMP1999" /NCGR_SAMPLE_ID=MMETSP1475 /ASSEMBLY_ACC=CAM_ASM_001111 /LENGTH=271 /DNA_ID=CAMNT_0044493157 /DNA_START=164 /DNA_END=979 /DNA_ORIENTATION=+
MMKPEDLDGLTVAELRRFFSDRGIKLNSIPCAEGRTRPVKVDLLKAAKNELAREHKEAEGAAASPQKLQSPAGTRAIVRAVRLSNSPPEVVRVQAKATSPRGEVAYAASVTSQRSPRRPYSDTAPILQVADNISTSTKDPKRIHVRTPKRRSVVETRLREEARNKFQRMLKADLQNYLDDHGVQFEPRLFKRGLIDLAVACEVEELMKKVDSGQHVASVSPAALRPQRPQPTGPEKATATKSGFSNVAVAAALCMAFLVGAIVVRLLLQAR